MSLLIAHDMALENSRIHFPYVRLVVYMFDEEKKVTGKVKWFNNTKGYGFIGRQDGPDVFVHYTAILEEGYRSLAEGDSVEFEIATGPKGPQATNVRKTKAE